MHRYIDLLNICLVTNRGCNLRCSHCYIQEDLLSSKERISQEMYELIYHRIGELLSLDKRIKGAAVETLGGEPTMMPYEFWEQYIPWSLNKNRELERSTKGEVVFAFCTNMILNDDRYIDLFNRYTEDPNMELFVSWEEDTGRYGKNNKLFSRYKENVLRVSEVNKTISLIPSKHLIQKSVEDLFSEIIEPLNINDISNDMLYQFGSGREFFRKSQPTYDEISQWYIELTKRAESLNITLSPKEEIERSILQEKPFHCMGNDAYDIEFEPDGVTTLNSSMTGHESIMPSTRLTVEDDDWAQKMIFENTSEIDAKIHYEHDYCYQCEYLSYCNGGYYHHKMLDRETLNSLSQDDCPGFKKYWDYISELHKDRPRRSEIMQKNRFKDVMAGDFVQAMALDETSAFIYETDLPKTYDEYFSVIIDPSLDNIMINMDEKFGKHYRQRLWFYDALGKTVGITDELLLQHPTSDKVVESVVYKNYVHFTLSWQQILKYVHYRSERRISQQIAEALAVVHFTPKCVIGEGLTILPSGMLVDDRNLEIFEWAYDVDMQELRYLNPKLYDRVCHIAMNLPVLKKGSAKALQSIISGYEKIQALNIS